MWKENTEQSEWDSMDSVHEVHDMNTRKHGGVNLLYIGVAETNRILWEVPTRFEEVQARYRYPAVENNKKNGTLPKGVGQS